VLDDVWSLPVEVTLQAIAKSRPHQSVSRVRFVQLGDSAGETIQLPILRSSAIEILGGGFGSASIKELFKAVPDFFQFAEKSQMKIEIKPFPLRDVEVLWSSAEQGDSAEVTLLKPARLPDSGQGHEWIRLYGTAILGRGDRRSGVLEPWNPVTDLLQMRRRHGHICPG
jgi:hypothetical protein